MKDPYVKLLNRKRTWTPIQTTAGKLKDGAEETIFRALAIRHMELPVGEFVTEALEKGVPDSARVLLESNVKDEIKHDQALGYVTNALGTDSQSEYEALKLRDAWEAHPDHTILKALVAERAIFFVRNTYDKYLDKKFWLDASDRLMYEGKAPEFSETQRARMPAFFEHANTNLPQYS